MSMQSLAEAAKQAHHLAFEANKELTQKMEMLAASQRHKETDYLNQLQKTQFFQDLQLQFFKAIAPISTTIMDIGIQFRDILSPEQSKELSEIGSKIASLPFKMLGGKIGLKEALHEFLGAMKSFGNFLKQNPMLAVKTASAVLTSLIPFGHFLKQAVKAIADVALPKKVKEPLIRGTGMLIENYDRLATQLEQAPELAARAKL